MIKRLARLKQLKLWRIMSNNVPGADTLDGFIVSKTLVCSRESVKSTQLLTLDT